MPDANDPAQQGPTQQGPTQQGEAPKIIVDSDWKSQAQQEKQRLAHAEAKKKAEAASGEGPPDPNAPVTISDLIKMMATQAMMYLGAYPDPQTGKAMVALDVAKLHVDLLGVLKEKTEGNLSEEEDKLLTGLVHELRLQYVEVSETIAKAIQEGKISPMGGAGGPGGDLGSAMGGSAAGGSAMGGPGGAAPGGVSP